MRVGATMAKAKGQAKGQAKAMPAKDPALTVRTLGFRVTGAYAAWLMRAAKHDRMTIATFIDKAVADRAAAIGFEEPPPERTS